MPQIGSITDVYRLGKRSIFFSKIALSALAWLATSSCLASSASEKLWLAVTTQELAPGVETLAAHRQEEGLRTEVFVGQPQEALEKFPNPNYLLLVGDVSSPNETPEPAWQIDAKTFPLYRWIKRQRKDFLSDSMWGDLNNDNLPEVPVGRLPVRTVDELQIMIKKIIDYENRPWTIEDLRLPVWTGDPMATPIFNQMATNFIVSQARAHSPKWGEVSFICGDVNSPFCGWPLSQAATFNRWLKRGGVFATIGAHGSTFSWYSVTHNNRWVNYDVRQQNRALQQGKPTCPLFVFTCDSGNFAAKGRAVTEAMVLAPGGPAAAVGATTESHPLPNTYAIRGLQHALQHSPERLGDLWVQALHLGYEMNDLLLQSLLKDLEGSLEDNINVAKLRRDQLRMYALMGDPATRIRVPRQLDATIRQTEKGWKWDVNRPDDATTLHLHLRTNEFKLPIRKSDMDQQSATELHKEANQLLAYKALQELTKEQNWTGMINEPGELRLVAKAPDGWYAAVLKVGK